MHFNGVAELVSIYFLLIAPFSLLKNITCLYIQVENRNNYLDSGYDELQGIHVRDNLESEYNEPQNTQVNDEE